MTIIRPLIFCCFFFAVFNLKAQVGIELNPDGIVIPRVYISEISNPQKGMLVFDLDSNTLRFYTGTNWNALNKSDLSSLSEILSAGNDAAEQRITNLGAPINDNDAATKAYVDIQGAGGTVQLGNELSSKLRLRFEGMVAGDPRGEHSVDLQSQRGYSDEVASGIKSTISGGDGNKASGHGATVSGGKKNAGTGLFSSISGGHDNEARGNYSSISGGQLNIAQGEYSFSGTGLNNQSLGRASATLGGQGLRATFYGQSSLGLFNELSETPDDELDEHLFVLGNGKSESNRSNAFVVSRRGFMGIGTSMPEANIHVYGSFRLNNGTERNGYFLSTDEDGNAEWTALPEDMDQQSIAGSSFENNMLTIGIENGLSQTLDLSSLDNNEDADSDPNNEIELPAGGEAGQVLQTNGSGTYQWVDPGVDSDEQSITGSSFENNILTIGIENGLSQTLDLSSLDNNEDADSDPNNEIELPAGGEAGQVLQTNGSGTYQWVDPGVDSDEQSITGSSFENNILTIGIENGLSQTLDLSSLDNNEDADSDPNNEIELPAGGEAGQVLQTNGSGTYQWVDPGVDSDEQSITGSSFENNILTIGIENGLSQTLDLSSLDNNEDADSDPTN